MVVELLTIWIDSCLLLSVKNILRTAFWMSTNMCSSVMTQKIKTLSNIKCQQTQHYKSVNIMNILLLFHKMIHRKFSDLMPMLILHSEWMNLSIWSILSWKLVLNKLQEEEEKLDKNSSNKRLKIFCQRCLLIIMKTKSDN